MAYCSECGVLVPPEAGICHGCGRVIQEATTSTPPKQSTQQNNYQQPPFSSPGMLQPRTRTGLPIALASGLCYVLTWITGLLFLLLEKERTVRFHALQSLFTFGGIAVLAIILDQLSRIAVIGGICGVLLTLLTWFSCLLWIFLMIRGFQGKTVKLPVVGSYAERLANT